MKISGTEWCPHCEADNDFTVDEDVWIVNCQHCGRPIVLCDKCRTMNGENNTAGCGECPHERKCNEILTEWEKSHPSRSFRLTITKTYTGEVDVDARSVEEAKEKAEAVDIDFWKGLQCTECEVNE